MVFQGKGWFCMSDGKRGIDVMRILAVAAPVAMAAALSGCASDGPSRQAPVVIYGSPDESSPDYDMPSGGPKNTGTYPTFGKPLRAATRQMGAEEVNANRAEMEAIAAARASGQISEAEYQARLAEMRRLAAEHGADAVKEIEN